MHRNPGKRPPGEFNDIQRRGFHDGIEGARRDYGNHRRPDVNNREEYRNSNLPPDVRDVYREAFRRGYEMAASHLWGGAPQPPPPPPPPQAVQPPRQDWDRWGMRGLDKAMPSAAAIAKAWKKPAAMSSPTAYQDPDDQPQFRNPPVPPPLADEYPRGIHARL